MQQHAVSGRRRRFNLSWLTDIGSLLALAPLIRQAHCETATSTTLYKLICFKFCDPACLSIHKDIADSVILASIWVHAAFDFYSVTWLSRGERLLKLFTLSTPSWLESDMVCWSGMQSALEYFEAIDGEKEYERNSEDLYAGGGQYRRAVERTPIEHFPQLWCNNGSYSVYGQVGLHCWSM